MSLAYFIRSSKTLSLSSIRLVTGLCLRVPLRLVDVSILRRLHRDISIEPVDALDLPLPDLEDVAGVLPVFADGLAPGLPGLYGVGGEQHAQLLDQLIRGVLGAQALVDLGVAHLDYAGDLAVRKGRVYDGPDVSRRAVGHYAFSLFLLERAFTTSMKLGSLASSLAISSSTSRTSPDLHILRGLSVPMGLRPVYLTFLISSLLFVKGLTPSETGRGPLSLPSV